MYMRYGDSDESVCESPFRSRLAFAHVVLQSRWQGFGFAGLFTNPRSSVTSKITPVLLVCALGLFFHLLHVCARSFRLLHVSIPLRPRRVPCRSPPILTVFSLSVYCGRDCAIHRVWMLDGRRRLIARVLRDEAFFFFRFLLLPRPSQACFSPSAFSSCWLAMRGSTPCSRECRDALPAAELRCPRHYATRTCAFFLFASAPFFIVCLSSLFIFRLCLSEMCSFPGSSAAAICLCTPYLARFVERPLLDVRTPLVHFLGRIFPPLVLGVRGFTLVILFLCSP
ncbi:hypothetical protein C8R45DRAFT_1025246 [Mycena sanguinolenta]|nr:hypothetical protein C8R45DRAFT_1025246 [Mycena sanguinolenta]